MPLNEVQAAWNQFDGWCLAEILKAKARFVHICLAAIMPKELYDLAAHDNQLDRCQKWATDQGYRWREGHGETQLLKGDALIARFKPCLVGEGEHRHCEFIAVLAGKMIQVVVPDEVGKE